MKNELILGKLKPCPFCGSDDVEAKGVFIYCDEGEFVEPINLDTGLEKDSCIPDCPVAYTIVCNKCGCRLDGDDITYDAIKHKYMRLKRLKDTIAKWNTRSFNVTDTNIATLLTLAALNPLFQCTAPPQTSRDDYIRYLLSREQAYSSADALKERRKWCEIIPDWYKDYLEGENK